MKLSKNVIRFIIVIIVALALFNVIAFVIPFAKNGTFWAAYIFGTISILLQIAVIKIAFTGTVTPKSKFYGFPIARIGVVYAIIQLILSIITMIISVFIPAWIPIVIFAIILGVSAVGFISADATRDEIVRQDEKIVKDVSYMRNIQSKVYMLVSQCNSENIRTEVQKLAEELKYSDPVSNESLKEIERELYFYIEDLQKAVVDNDNTAIEICQKATAVLAERNRLCKLNKNNV